MSAAFNEFTLADEEFYLTSSKEFYNLPFVAHPVNEKNFQKTFQMCIDKIPFVKGLIIEWDGEKAGYALASVTYSNEAGGMCLWIEEVYILSAFRGQGIAKQLFAFIEREWIPEHGIKRVRLEVTENNQAAIGLYKQIGFELLKYQQMVKDF